MYEIPIAGTLDLGARANLARNFLERTVDPITGQPYFDVFDASPPELFHDWPDFGDLTSRYWEAALMVQEMTGSAPANLDRLKELALSYIAGDGLSYRAATPYSTNVAEMFDQSRTLYALCSAYMHRADEPLRLLMPRMVDRLISLSVRRDGYRFIPGCRYKHGEWESPIDFENAPEASYFIGVLLRPLVRVWSLLSYDPALELASDLTRFLLDKARTFDEDGRFDGHIHSRLSAAAGLYVCGKATGDAAWVELARKAWEYARELSGPCGFTPEVLNNPGHPVFRCETCAVMDYLELTMLLAEGGDEALWGIAEKTLRSHLIESQLTCTDWARKGSPKSRDEYSINDHAAERMLGGFAGWSALDHLLAVAPTLHDGWLQADAPPELYLRKERLFQNCCGPAGQRALYLAWSRASVVSGNTLNINFLLNRSLPEVDIAVAPGPHGDTLVVKVSARDRLDVRLRYPDWARSQQPIVSINGKAADAVVEHDRIVFRGLEPGSEAVVVFPIETSSWNYTVNHLDGSYAEYRIRMFGDSALEVLKTNEQCGQAQPHSDLLEKCSLYQRRKQDLYAPDTNPPICLRASINWFPEIG